jgi:HTH-type transcriptional regulator/antitoxin HigA
MNTTPESGKNRYADSRYPIMEDVSDTIFVPHTEEKYERLVSMLDGLIDQVGEDESHPLASLMDVISALFENYESVNVPEFSLKQAVYLKNENLNGF